MLTLYEQFARLSQLFPSETPMDTLDTQLISLLRDNARIPISTLATQLKVSRGTVQNRIDKLLEERILLGFTVRTTPEAASHRIRAITMVRTEGDADQVLRTLRGYPEVRALHTTNGRWDIVAELATDTLQEFDEVLRQIGKVRGVANTETSLLLSTHKL